jgi:hypothetical protein
MPFTPAPMPIFWIHFTDDRESRPVDDLDAMTADLTAKGEVEGITFTVGGPF